MACLLLLRVPHRAQHRSDNKWINVWLISKWWESVCYLSGHRHIYIYTWMPPYRDFGKIFATAVLLGPLTFPSVFTYGSCMACWLKASGCSRWDHVLVIIRSAKQNLKLISAFVSIDKKLHEVERRRESQCGRGQRGVLEGKTIETVGNVT